MKFTRNDDFLFFFKWSKIKGENEKNAWANVFKMINQTLDQKYKKKRMKLVKES